MSAASPKDATDPAPKRCRDFLQAVLDICHHVVLTDEIRAEWDLHQSAFAREWRQAMVQRRKVFFSKAGADHQLRDKVEGAFVGERQQAAVWKDCCLLEAALDADMRIVLLDRIVHDLLREAANTVREIERIILMDPVKDHDATMRWIESGAPAGRERWLRAAKRTDP